MKKLDRTLGDSDSKSSTPPQPVQKNGPRWSAVRAVRLPHKIGAPLGSGGSGDTAIR